MSASTPRLPRARRRLPAAGLLTLALLLPSIAGPPSAGAETRVVKADAVRGPTVVYRLKGVAPSAIAAAHVRAGRARVRVSLRRARRGARRGTLRVRVRGARRSRQALRRRSVLVLRLARRGKRGPKPSKDPITPTEPVPEEPPSTTEPVPETAPDPDSGSVPPPDPGTPLTPPEDALYVSPTGSDSNSGSESAPWRTLAKAVSAACPGDTVVLRAGDYGAAGTTSNVAVSGTASAPITFMGYPGEPKPRLQGYVRITGSHLRFSGLLFDGPTGPVLPRTTSNPGGEEVQVSVMYGTGVEISHSEVRDNLWHAGIYVYDATGVRLLANWIHHNGDRSRPEQANLDHGIYWSKGSGLVANNLVQDNLAYGVHLYPEASNVTVTHNTIVGHGRGGVIIAERASSNRIANNVIASNAYYGIRGYALTGAGNVASSNLVWDNGQENFSGSGIALSDNLVADPRFVGPDDFRLQSSSPAIDLGDPAWRVETDRYGSPRGALPDAGAHEAG